MYGFLLKKRLVKLFRLVFVIGVSLVFVAVLVWGVVRLLEFPAARAYDNALDRGEDIEEISGLRCMFLEHGYNYVHYNRPGQPILRAQRDVEAWFINHGNPLVAGQSVVIESGSYVGGHLSSNLKAIWHEGESRYVNMALEDNMGFVQATRPRC